jgi:hypothetical protein
VSDKLQIRQRQLDALVSFVRDTHSTIIGDYQGDDYDEILRLLFSDRTMDVNSRYPHHVDLVNALYTTADGEQHALAVGPSPSSPVFDRSNHQVPPTTTREIDDFLLPLQQLTNASAATSFDKTGRDRLRDGELSTNLPLFLSTPTASLASAVWTASTDESRLAEGTERGEGVGRHQYYPAVGLNNEISATHDLAHGLHFASIGMLGVLVIEVSSLPFRELKCYGSIKSKIARDNRRGVT